MSTQENQYLKVFYKALSSTNDSTLFPHWKDYPFFINRDIEYLKSLLLQIGDAKNIGNISDKASKLNLIREKIQQSNGIVNSFKRVFGELLKNKVAATQESIDELGSVLESKIILTTYNKKKDTVRRYSSATRSSLYFPIFLFQQSRKEMFLLYSHDILDMEILPDPETKNIDMAQKMLANVSNVPNEGENIEEEDSEDEEEKAKPELTAEEEAERIRNYGRCQRWPPPPQPRKEHEIPRRTPEKKMENESDFTPHIRRLPTHNSKKIISDYLSSTLISLCSQRKKANQTLEKAWFSGFLIESKMKALPGEMLENQIEMFSEIGKKIHSFGNPKFVEITEKIQKCCSEYEMFCDLVCNDTALNNNLKAMGETSKKASLIKTPPVTTSHISYKLRCGHQLGSKYFQKIAQELKDRAKDGPIQFRCPYQCGYVLSEKDLYALLDIKFKSITSRYDNYSVICMFCGEKSLERLVRIHCQHFLCEPCLYSLLKNSTEGKMIVIDRKRVSSSKKYTSDTIPVIPIKCPARTCTYQMDISIIKLAMDKRDFDIACRKALAENGLDYDMPTKSRYTIKCIICSHTVDEADGYEMKCHHGYCNTCIKAHLDEQFRKGKGAHGMQCVEPGCKQTFDLYILKLFLGQENFQKLEERTVMQKSEVFACPRCKIQYPISSSLNSVNIVCIVCGEEICRLCNHPLHRKICKLRTKWLSDLNRRGLEVRPCPYCLQFSIIAEGSVQTTCYFCKNNFCSLCSAKLTPILAHGNHYHRPSCKYFEEMLDLDYWLPDQCWECKQLAIRCERPKNLEEGDIPYQEKPDCFK